MAAIDEYQYTGKRNVQDPVRGYRSLTGDDDNDLTEMTRGLHANTDGDVYVDGPDVGTNVKLTLVAGTLYPYRITRLYATNTTADVVGLY